MMMKPAPAAPLKVSEAKFLLQVLVITLDAPTHFCNLNEAVHRRACGQRREPVFDWLGLAIGPFNQQPFLVAWRGPPVIAV